MMVAGSGRACTQVMQALAGRVLVKTGAEGVFAGSVPEHGIGFALKIDDGARRASEVVLGAVLEALNLLHPSARQALKTTFNPAVVNSRAQQVGELRVPNGLIEKLRKQ